MRDIYKTAQQAKINERYDMTLGEFLQLKSIAPAYNGNIMYEVISTAFRYGYEMGTRAERARVRARASKSNL